MSDTQQVESCSPDQESPKKEVQENGHEDSKETAPQEEKPTDVNEETKEEQDEADEGEEKDEKGESKDEAEDEKGDTDEEESSDEEPPQGSLDGPVKLMTGKRERKKVERLSMEQTKETSPDKKLEIPEGKGTKLGEIPNVNYHITRTNAESLKPLHRVLFARQGKISDMRKNMRKFSGFTFEKDSGEYKRKEATLLKFSLPSLKDFCTWLDVEKTGSRDEVAERLLAFCLEPKASDRPLPTKKKVTKAKKKKKKKKVGPKGDAPKLKKTTEKAPKRQLDEDEIDEDNDEEDMEPKKKKPRKETPKKPKVKNPSKSPQKKKTPAKMKSRSIVDSDSDSDEDEPLLKKTKAIPSDTDIRNFIKDFLDGANLEEVTMKTVCKKVYDNYPEFDLSHKKDFIKTTVKEIIST